jgi:uncharacterized repeat protein (TIGR02543 family)
LGQGTLVKTNWTFKGWSTNQTATTEQYTQGSTFTISAATVLFAVWTENPKYTVVYDGNGATSGSAPVDPDSSYYTGSTVTVLGQGSLLKANHNFIGWSTTQNAISAQFTQGQTFTITENTWLFAVWEEYPKYSVVYDGNGSTDGVTPSDSGMYYQGSSVTVLANTGGLTKTGYVFKGWATSSAAVVTPDFVVSGSTVTPSTFTMGSANVTLYAVWEEDLKYSVTYLGNGADSGDTPVDTGSPYESGTTVTVLGQNTLQKTGYIFLGWSTNSAASSPQYTAGQKFVISQNLVFYAVWLPDDEPPPPTFHVYYNSNAPAGVTVTGEVPQDDTLYLEEQTVTVLANTGGLACAVYRFLGWAKVRNLVEPAFTVDGDTVSPPTFVMAATDVTLYAVWQPIPLFTVTYQPNGATGGSVPVDGNTYVEGATVTVLGSNTLTKTNYTFIGWNVNSSSTTALYVQNETFTITGSSVVLYAIWRENTKYSVTYSGNGASDGTAPVDVNSPYYAGSQVVVLNRGSLALAGYEFLGWSTNNTATEAEYVAGDVFQLGTANVTLHAIWRLIPLTYSVTYRANWSDGGESGLGSPPLDTNSYLANSTVEVQANPNNLTLSGYRLLGWSANQYATAPTYVIIGDTVSPASFTIGAADVVLYAVWEQIMYYRTIYHDNGSEGGVAPVDGGLYEQGDRVVVLANSGNLFRVGYVFVGWALSASAVDAVFVVSNSGYVEPASFIMAIVDVHLYPVWQQVVMYTVTYHPNGADSGEVPENQNRFMPGSLVSVRANSKNLAKVGYIFLGWATTASATHPDYTVDGEIVSPGSFSITADVVLFAVWLARIIYKIAYNANWPDDTAGSGVVPVDNTVYYFEDFALVQANPGQLGKTGYSFTGWIYNNQMFHINGSTVTPSTVQVVEGVVFFGVWTLNEPQKYVHYGLLENAKVLIRTAYVADFNPPRDELISPVLSQCLVMGSAWVDGVVSAAGVKLPFVKVPEILAHICELYAAGRYLQRSIPEEKTHPYIMEAQQYLTQWLEQAKENGLVEETIRPPAIALGRFHS